MLRTIRAIIFQLAPYLWTHKKSPFKPQGEVLKVIKERGLNRGQTANSIWVARHQMN